MNPPPGRPARSSLSLSSLLYGVMFGTGGAVVTAVLLYQCWSWRDFDWKILLILLPLSVMFSAISVSIVTASFSLLRVPAKGSLVAADHGAYLLTGVLALWWSLLAFPLASVAVAAMVHEWRVAHLVAFVFFAAAMALAGKAWRLYDQRWLLGSPLLERLESRRNRFKARIHFHPALGQRLTQGALSYQIGVEVRQVAYATTVRMNTTTQTAWYKNLGANDVAHGACMIEIETDAPAWRSPTGKVWPACWEVTLRALGTSAVFRLAP